MTVKVPAKIPSNLKIPSENETAIQNPSPSPMLVRRKPVRDSSSASMVSSSSSSVVGGEDAGAEMSPPLVVEGLLHQLSTSDENDSSRTLESKTNGTAETENSTQEITQGALHSLAFCSDSLSLPPDSVVECLEDASFVHTLRWDDACLLPPNPQLPQRPKRIISTGQSKRNKKKQRGSEKSTKGSQLREHCSEDLARLVAIPRFKSANKEVYDRLQHANSALRLQHLSSSSGSTNQQDSTYYMLYRWIRTRIRAGMVRSSLVMLHRILGEGYEKAGDLLLKVEDDQYDDNLRQLIGLRRKLAATWCVYAHIILEVGEQVLEEATEIAVVPKPKPRIKNENHGKLKSPKPQTPDRPKKTNVDQYEVQKKGAPGVAMAPTPNLPLHEKKSKMKKPGPQSPLRAKPGHPKQKNFDQYGRTGKPLNASPYPALTPTSTLQYQQPGKWKSPEPPEVVRRKPGQPKQKSLDQYETKAGLFKNSPELALSQMPRAPSHGNKGNRQNSESPDSVRQKGKRKLDDHERIQRIKEQARKFALAQTPASPIFDGQGKRKSHEVQSVVRRKRGRPKKDRSLDGCEGRTLQMGSPTPRKRSAPVGFRTPVGNSVRSEQRNGTQPMHKRQRTPSRKAKKVHKRGELLNHAISILLAARTCPLVRDSTLISLSLGRLIVSGTAFSAAKTREVSSEQLLHAVSSAISSCWDSIDTCHGKHDLPKRIQMQNHPGISIDLISEHEFKCRPVHKESRVSAEEVSSAMESVLELPARLEERIQSKNTIFRDRNTLRALCTELNRLSRLKEHIKMGMGLAIAPSKGETLLDNLQMFAAFDKLMERDNSVSLCADVAYVAKEYANGPAPGARTIVWNW